MSHQRGRTPVVGVVPRLSVVPGCHPLTPQLYQMLPLTFSLAPARAPLAAGEAGAVLF